MHAQNLASNHSHHDLPYVPLTAVDGIVEGATVILIQGAKCLVKHCFK